MAEFYQMDGSLEKLECYRNFRECFDKVNEVELFKRYEIPFEGTHLPAIHIKATNQKGVLLVHGGYDSFMEEFYPVVKDMINYGYTIIRPRTGTGKKKRVGFPL